MKKLKSKNVFFIVIAVLILCVVGYVNYPKRGTFNNLVIKKYSDKKIRNVTILRSNEPENLFFDDVNKINNFLDYMSSFSLVENKHYLEKTSKVNYNKHYTFLISYVDSSMLGIEVWNNEYIEVYLKILGKQTRLEKYKITDDSFDIDVAYNSFKD